MHILYLCEEYPPPVTGGIGQVVRLLAEGLVARGHQATVIGQYRVEDREEYEQDGVRVVKLPRPRRSKVTRNELVRRWLLARDVRRLIRHRGVDIVESPSYMGDGAFLGKKPGGIHHVLRVHGTESAKPSSVITTCKRFSHYLERRVTCSSDSIVLVGEGAGTAFLQNMQCAKRRFAVIPNPVDVRLFSPVKTTCRNPYVLYVGRIDRLKGAFAFAKCLRRILETFPDLRVRFAGADGREDTFPISRGSEVVLDSVPQLERHRVEFLGRVPHSTLIREIRGAVLCVLPSLYENFPCAVVEAMACGKCVVASSRAYGNEVLTHDHSGVLVDPLDTESMCSAIVELLQDSGRRILLGNNARRLAERRNCLDTVLAANVHYYESCLSGSPLTGELLPLEQFALPYNRGFQTPVV